MKKIVGLLTLLAFFIISQAGLFHALDMIIMSHDIVKMQDSKTVEPVFCSKGNFNDTKGCFQEITESKWVSGHSNKIIEITIIIFILGLLSISSIVDNSSGGLPIVSTLKHGPPKATYQALYGIIRNQN